MVGQQRWGWRLARLMSVMVLLSAGGGGPALAQQTDDLTALSQRVQQLHQEGQYAEALPIAQRALTLAKQRFGDNHAEVGNALNNLAVLYHARGEYTEAEPLYRRALALYEKMLDPNHLDLGKLLNNLAFFYDDQRRYAEAEPLYQRALAIYEKALGPDHPKVNKIRDNLAALHQVQGDHAEAEKVAEAAATKNAAGKLSRLLIDLKKLTEQLVVVDGKAKSMEQVNGEFAEAYKRYASPQGFILDIRILNFKNEARLLEPYNNGYTALARKALVILKEISQNQAADVVIKSTAKELHDEVEKLTSSAEKRNNEENLTTVYGLANSAALLRELAVIKKLGDQSVAARKKVIEFAQNGIETLKGRGQFDEKHLVEQKAPEAQAARKAADKEKITTPKRSDLDRKPLLSHDP